MASVEEQSQMQKMALLQAVADQGSTGRQAIQQAGAQIGQERQAALSSLSGYANSPEQVGQAVSGGQLSQDRSVQDLAALRGRLDQDLSRQQSGMQNYLGQVNQAVPLEREVTGRQQAKLQFEEREAQKERDLRRQAMEMQLEGQRLSLQGQRESNASQASGGGGSSGGGGGFTPLQAGNITRDAQKAGATAAEQSRQKIVDSFYKLSKPGTDASGKTVQTPFQKAFDQVVLNQGSLQASGAAINKYPGLTQRQRDSLAGWAENYWATGDRSSREATDNYFAQYGG